MKNLFKRAIGQILLDGKFVSPRALNRALDEQKRTKELLGQVLVRMGVLKESDVNAPLLIQGHLNQIEDAVRLAAGKRQLLGALLVHSGRISGDQLDHAIAEQKRTGEKLGEVFVRLRMLTELQLKGLLDLQHNQELGTQSPLRLGELLIATGCITREQLDLALNKQTQTGKRLGEVLVAEGYLSRTQVNHGMRLQKMLCNSVVAAILSFGVTATASASSVALQWDPSPDAAVAGYKVHYQADSAAQPFQGTAVDLPGATTTSTTVENLDPAHGYSFAVTAYDASGAESAYSNVVTIPEMLAPATSISYPANATTVAGTVSVTADAADNVGVTKVEFYLNGTMKASTTAAPHMFSWDTTATPPGSYTLTAKAYDAAGNIGQSQSVTVTVANDLLAPTVSLTSPSDYTTVAGSVSISAAASDNVGVAKVEIFLDDVLLAATNIAPYSYNWDTKSVANGVHTVTAKAYDAMGNLGRSQTVTVNVSNDLVAPTVSLTSPGSGATVGGTVNVSASASDNVGVSRVEFYRNGALVATSNSAPYGFSWDTESVPNGSYTLTAKAYDAAGNVGQSQYSSVTVSNDYTAPMVGITSPASGSTLRGNVTVTVDAADNVGVNRVEYYLNGALLGTAGSAPYSFDWNTKTMANGNYAIMAKAYDDAGNVAQSNNVLVTVKNNVRK